jgi:predicted lipid-binding transport protein (Tim44 family)
MYDKTSLFAWTVQLHNIVNKETGKREWTTEEARTFYTTGAYADATGAENKGEFKSWPGILAAGALLGFIACFIFFQLKTQKRR